MATHYSILAWRIPKDREAWRATVHGVTKSLTRLSDFTSQRAFRNSLWGNGQVFNYRGTFDFYSLFLIWKIPWILGWGWGERDGAEY